MNVVMMIKSVLICLGRGCPEKLRSINLENIQNLSGSGPGQPAVADPA